MENIENDIKMLKLAKLLKKAHALTKEIKGFSYCYINSGSVDIHISNQAGKDSNLAFTLSDKSWERNEAKCLVAEDITVQFTVEEKTVLVAPVESATEDKAA